MILLGWSPMDAFYMTIITLTTVGFREVGELGTVGMLWTSVLAIAAVAIIFGTVGIAAEFIVEEVTSGRREVRRMQEAIDALNGHFVLCGYGRVGATVARELVDAGESVVVVDLIQESLERAREDGHLVVLGDATTDAILRQAGVERARGLVTAIDTDALNVYVILSARQLNPGLTIIGRANTLEAEEKLLRAGADRIVSPYTRAGHRMAELAVRPGVVDYLDAALDHREAAFGLESVAVVAGRAGWSERRRRARGGHRRAGHRSRRWRPCAVRVQPVRRPSGWQPASRSSRAAMRRAGRGCESGLDRAASRRHHGGHPSEPHEESMMPTISEVAARATFGDLVSRVAYGGERVVVTRRGERFVALVPAEDMALLELLESELDLGQARDALADPENARPIDWDTANMHRGS